MPEATEAISQGALVLDREPAVDRDPATERDPITERMSTIAGLGPLVAEAEAIWLSRAVSAAGSGCVQADVRRPGWRPFEDAFPTFYQFTNRPPR
jgi:hypothetical protein